VNSSGGEANGGSFLPAMGQTGRFVAFASDASNLVTGDTNGVTDVFLRDTNLGTTTLVSRASNGTLGNGATTKPDLSADGRYLLFTSEATNFVANDDNNATDAFVRDLQTGTTRLVSKATDGGVANGTSIGVQLTDNGKEALVFSDAANIEANTSSQQLYLANPSSNTITRATKVSLCPLHESYHIADASMTGDASHIAYAIQCYGPEKDFVTPAEIAIVIRNRVAGTNRVAWTYHFDLQPFDDHSVSSLSYAKNGSALAWVLIHNFSVHGFEFTPYLRKTGHTAKVLQIENQVTALALSPDGRSIAYRAPLPDYQADLPTSKVKLFDIAAAQSHVVSVNQYGQSDFDEPNGDSSEGTFSGDGKYIAFISYANDIVADDTNGAPDVFTRPVNLVLSGGSAGAQRVSR
jgi:Tol biopolymer transport system component